MSTSTPSDGALPANPDPAARSGQIKITHSIDGPIFSPFPPDPDLPEISAILDRAVSADQTSITIGDPATPHPHLESLARTFYSLLITQKRRFLFSLITFSVPPDDITFQTIFGQTLHVTPDSTWNKTSRPEEVPLNHSRSFFVSIAIENATLYNSRSYLNRHGVTIDLAPLISESSTDAIPPDRSLPIPDPPGLPGLIELSQETTIGALYRLIVLEGFQNSIALNFANPHEPGGGYLRGARAQEEACCRQSTLFYELVRNGSAMYRFNEEDTREEPLFSDYELITRNVVVWRDDAYRMLDEPFVCSFVTSPAPLAKEYLRMGVKNAKEVLHEVMDQRIRRIVDSVIAGGFTTVVLGAFGCGAFGNDPEDVAQIFYQVLVTEGKRAYFERILFAVWDPYQKNWKAFKARFGEETE